MGCWWCFKLWVGIFLEKKNIFLLSVVLIAELAFKVEMLPLKTTFSVEGKTLDQKFSKTCQQLFLFAVTPTVKGYMRIFTIFLSTPKEDTVKYNSVKLEKKLLKIILYFYDLVLVVEN